MTNRIAIWLAILILSLFVADRFWLGWDLHVHILYQLDRFIEYLAFWR